MTTPDIYSVADEGNEFLNSSIVNHQRRLTESIAELERNIINQVKEFKTTDGTLLGPRVNMKQAQKIHTRLKKMFDDTYGVEARQVVRGFNGAAKYIQNELSTLGVPATFTSVDKDMIGALKTSTWGTFNKFGLQTQEQLVDQMYNAVIGKTPFATLVTNVQGILSGHVDARGRSMSVYARLYANDSIMNFHNSVHMKKADDAGLKHFLYYGNLMNGSRDFCIQRVGKVFSREVIDSWDFPWGGKSGPAYTNRGGYNCRHRWVAVKKKWVDKDVEIIDKVGQPIEPKGLAAELKPSEKLPAEIRAKMSARQVTALDNYVPSNLKSRTIAEQAERRVAEGIDADHIIGKRPFDSFLDKEFIENKTFVSGRGQIRMRPSSKKKKTDFLTRYRVRGHTVAVDMREGSETYGKIFHRRGLGDFQPHTMTEVKNYDHLQELLKKGSRPMPELHTAYRTGVPTAKDLKAAENYAKKNLKIVDVDYDEIDKKAGDSLNRYIGGMIDKTGVTPKAVIFDDAMFAKGASRRYAAIAMEDGTLYLNRKMFKNVDMINRLSSHQFAIGEFTTSSEGHVLRHEMGHLKYFELGGTEVSARKKLTRGMINDLKAIGPENLPRYVSIYAQKNQGEFYAEMIAKQMNGERLHPVCVKMMRDIEDNLKKLKKVKRLAKGEGLAAKVSEADRFGGGTTGAVNVIKDLSSVDKQLAKTILVDMEAAIEGSGMGGVLASDFEGLAKSLGLRYERFNIVKAGKVTTKKGFIFGNREFINKRSLMREIRNVGKTLDLKDVKVVIPPKKVVKEVVAPVKEVAKKVEKVKKAKKVKLKGREALQKRYDEILAKFEESSSYMGRYEAHIELTEAHIELARTFSQEELRAAKTKILIDDFLEFEEGVKMSVGMKKKMEHIAEWVPFDLLMSIRSRGGKIIVQKTKIRAHYSKNGFECRLYTGDTGSVFSHEFSHMIDGSFASDFQAGFQWRTSKFSTREEAEDLRKLFRGHHSKGKKGFYKNGDGAY